MCNLPGSPLRMSCTIPSMIQGMIHTAGHETLGAKLVTADAHEQHDSICAFQYDRNSRSARAGCKIRDRSLRMSSRTHEGSPKGHDSDFGVRIEPPSPDATQVGQ